jgi:protein-L-isoaspartate(D-aspartate) O-methyltransferase
MALSALASPSGSRFVAERAAMVESLAARDPAHPVKDARVLQAMREVPRHAFVPKKLEAKAYGPRALPIGKGQSVSEPFVIATMLQTLSPKPTDNVLEIGTGSGYQAALLSRLAREVYTIEIVSSLAKKAQRTLGELGYSNVHVRTGDGYLGWPEKAPFDAIIVSCAPDHIPAKLVEQLALGGRLLIPVGGTKKGAWTTQSLVVVRKTESGLSEESALGVHFEPMAGRAGR